MLRNVIFYSLLYCNVLLVSMFTIVNCFHGTPIELCGAPQHGGTSGALSLQTSPTQWVRFHAKWSKGLWYCSMRVGLLSPLLPTFGNFPWRSIFPIAGLIYVFKWINVATKLWIIWIVWLKSNNVELFHFQQKASCASKDAQNPSFTLFFH